MSSTKLTVDADFTDGSPLGNKAAKAGIALAKALGARVTACYAIEQLELVYDESYMMDQKRVHELEEPARSFVHLKG